MWQALLRFAVDERLDALIDCGALLAGTTNRCTVWSCLLAGLAFKSRLAPVQAAA
jgi:hypothetical protein